MAGAYCPTLVFTYRKQKLLHGEWQHLLAGIGDNYDWSYDKAWCFLYLYVGSTTVRADILGLLKHVQIYLNFQFNCRNGKNRACKCIYIYIYMNKYIYI